MDAKTKWLIAGGVFLFLWFTGILGGLIRAFTGYSWGGPFFWLIILIGGPLLLATVVNSGRRTLNQNNGRENLDRILRVYGEDRQTRAAGLNKAFDEKSGSIDYKLDRCSRSFVINTWSVTVPIGRSLASMSPRDREALRTALLLYNEGAQVSVENTANSVLALLWGEGKATVFQGGSVKFLDKTLGEAVTWWLNPRTADSSVGLVLRELQQAIKEHPENAVVQRLAGRMLGDTRNLDAPDSLATAAPGAVPGDFLIVGGDDKTLYGVTGEGSLLTVAPPGSGKTQCHVIPNLLNWDGPAIVLDVKGEIFPATSGWRAKNVGPVYKFSPLAKEGQPTHRYNPLAEVSREDDQIWEDARFVADMLIVPGRSKEPFWEDKARDAVRAAIAYVVKYKEPEDRNMQAVLDILHGVEWEAFLVRMEGSGLKAMQRASKSMGEMDQKMRDSVMQTALGSLSAWEGERVARATAQSDWRPDILRDAAKPTIYICLAPNQVDSFASLLRVVIAQHIRALTATEPPKGAPPILFILDELPRLRYMPPIEEAVDVGRGYGLKLWMFTQNLGQLKTAYENATGMVGNCVVRMFMNPSQADQTAEALSDQIGEVVSLVDGEKVKRVSAQMLAGPEFKDRVIVMPASGTPGSVAKHYAYADMEMASRMSEPPAEPKGVQANGA